MPQTIDGYGVRATDDVRSDDTSGSDAEVDELRSRELEPQAAYVRDPWNVDSQRALVRVHQKIRHLEESAQRLADNGPTKPPRLDAAEYARHGSAIRWVASPALAQDSLDVTTPVGAFTDSAQIKKQIAFTEAAIGFGHPELVFRLGELKRRLSDVQAHQPARPPAIVPRPPVATLGHGDCTTPRPIALPGNAARIADAHVDLEASLQGAGHLTTPELERYIDAYVAYTAIRPELKAQYDRAVARGPVILASRLDAEETDRERVAMRAHVEDQVRPLRVKLPIPVQQRAVVGEVAIPIAKAVDIVAQFTPVVRELLFALETITGHEMAGLGPKMEQGERALNAALLLAPFAAALLKEGVRGAAAIVRIAHATGKTPEQVRTIVISARELDKDRALVLRLRGEEGRPNSFRRRGRSGCARAAIRRRIRRHVATRHDAAREVRQSRRSKDTACNGGNTNGRGCRCGSRGRRR